MFLAPFKILCLFAFARSVFVASTPPTAPPEKQEVVSRTVSEFIRVHVFPKSAQTLISLLALLESICIVSYAWPDVVPYSSTILSHLAPQAGARKLDFSPTFVLSLVLILIGASVRYQCYRALGHFFTFEVAIRKDHRLITNGPYAYCRHPGYLGVLCCYLGITLFLVSPGSWARESGFLASPVGFVMGVFELQMMFTVAGLMLRLRQEDSLLRKEFGKQWEDWAKKVPYLLVPGIF